MPKSPTQFTLRHFLKSKPPDPSPSPPGKMGKTARGKKRQLSLSPQSPPGDTVKAPASNSHISSDASASPFPPLPPPSTTVSPNSKGKNGVSPPLLPYQLRTSKKLKASLSLPLLSSSSMDLLELGQDDFDATYTPTSDEADALLKEDNPLLSDSRQPTDEVMEITSPSQNEAPFSSPTAAIKAAIEAQIDEGMSSEILQFDATLNAKTNAKSNAAPLPPPPPAKVPTLPKPLPLFPNGLPFSIGTKSGPPKSKNPQDPKANPNDTYAAKAKTPPKGKVMVENILYVYRSRTTKRPLSSSEWEHIDDALIEAQAVLDLNADPIRIVNSGYDAAHRCGFIACRDLISANWCKAAILDMGKTDTLLFRAWSKGEQPEIRRCRLFFPSRFDRIGEDTIIPLLIKHNPPFRAGSLTLKSVEDVQNGRAVFIDFDPIGYAHVRDVKHRVEFLMQDIDCQVFVPKQPAKPPQGPGVSGITKLAPLSQTSSATPSMSKSSASNVAASLEKPALNTDPRLNKRAQPPLAFLKAPTPVVVEDNSLKKRNRSLDSSGTDGAKKPFGNP